MANPNELEWCHYQDVQVPDISIREQFVALMKQGYFKEGLQLLFENREQLEGKAFVKDTLEVITNSCFLLEAYFITGVNVFLNTTAANYQVLINNLRNKNRWSDSIEYKQFNFVLYKGVTYMAIQDVPLGVFPDNTSYWIDLDIAGDEGAPGIANVEMKFAWSGMRQYIKYDIVSFQGNLYIALKDNKNVQPTEILTWLPFLIVSKGEIFIGDEPQNKSKGMIWFQPDSPVTNTTPVSGIFKVYTGTTWVNMYLETVFTLINDIEKYRPKLSLSKIVIESSDWKKDILDSKWKYSIGFDKVFSNSFVEIWMEEYPDKTAVEIYNSLKIEIRNGFIDFITDSDSVDTNVYLYIKIQ